MLRQGILKREVSLYHWSPVWLVWIILFCKWKQKIVGCHTADSKPVKQEVNVTVILSPLLFPGCSIGRLSSFSENIGLALKLLETNTPAHIAPLSVTKKKSFYNIDSSLSWSLKIFSTEFGRESTRVFSSLITSILGKLSHLSLQTFVTRLVLLRFIMPSKNNPIWLCSTISNYFTTMLR